MNIINWQKVLTFHQFYTWNSFEKLIKNRILYIVTGHEQDIRLKQGWSFPDLSEHAVIHLNKFTWLIEGIRILESNKDALHVFPSFWVEPRYFPFILYAVIRQIRTVVLVEPYSTETVGYLKDEAMIISAAKVKIRPYAYKIVAAIIQRLGKSDRLCILAISTKARRQMVKAGFRQEQIFPFGYFVPKAQIEKKAQNNEHTQLRLVFVGSLIKRKGIDIAIKAMELVAAHGYAATLDLYGAGEPNMISSLDTGCVRYRGCFPSNEAQQVISNYDVLLLPSRHDGWGVVINEALLQGVPVIVSEQVGAGVLVRNSGAGILFESGNVEHLFNVIVDLITLPEKLSRITTNAMNIGAQIAPDTAANYLLRIFRFYFLKEGILPKVLWDEYRSTQVMSTPDH